MLFDVECPHCKRIMWCDLVFSYGRKVYAQSLLDLEEYTLKYAKVEEVFTEDEVTEYIKKCLEILKPENTEELLEVFGISKESLNKLLKKFEM